MSSAYFLTLWRFMQLILVVPCYAQSQPILWATRLQILEVKLMEIIKVDGNFFNFVFP